MFGVTRQYALLRMGAFLLDALLVALLLILPATVSSWVVIQSGGAMNWIARIWNITFILFLAGILVRDGRAGRSLGKRIMGLELVHRRGRGFASSVLRNLPLVVPVLNIAEILVILFTQGGRRLGDRLAGTTVVEE